MKQVIELLKGLPIWAKLLIAAAIVWLVWVYIIPYIMGLFTSASAKGDLVKLGAQGEKPTLTDATAQSVADEIYNSGNVLWTNDNSQLEDAFSKIKNDADFDLVKEKFGTQTWGYLGVILPGKGDLNQFVVAFFDASEIQKLNAILKSNGVTYTL